MIILDEPLSDKKTSKIALAQHHPRYGIPFILRVILVLYGAIVVLYRGEYLRVIVNLHKVLLRIVFGYQLSSACTNLLL